MVELSDMKELETKSTLPNSEERLAIHGVSIDGLLKSDALDTVHIPKIRERDAVPEKSSELKRKRADTLDEDDKGEDPKTKARTKRAQLRAKRGPPRTRENQKDKNAFLQGRVQDRLKGVKPKINVAPQDIVAKAINKHANAENKIYGDALKRLSKEKPSSEQMVRVEKAKSLGPNYLGRTASLAPGLRFGTSWRATNGYTTNLLLMPAADTLGNQFMHAGIADMSQGRLQYMLASHLMWKDSPSDEFLSYSEDPLFLVVHALNRYNKKQGNVTIQFIDRRKAKDISSQPAAFYRALDLYDTFEVPAWMACTVPNEISLRPRKFSQEYLTHSTVIVDDYRFAQADIEKLIADGPYDIFPHFKVDEGHKRVGLYSGQVHFRSKGYPPTAAEALREPNGRIYSYTNCDKSTPLTVDFLEKVQKLTLNFMNGANDLESVEPHLHIFLSFLTFEKRPKRDKILLDWLKKHYKAEDVQDLYSDGLGGVQPGFTEVAENLPGVMQYVDLVDDANHAFGLSDLPARVVRTKNDLTGEVYANEDAKPHMRGEASEPYNEDAINLKRDKAAESRKRRREDKKWKASSGENTAKADSKNTMALDSE